MPRSITLQQRLRGGALVLGVVVLSTAAIVSAAMSGQPPTGCAVPVTPPGLTITGQFPLPAIEPEIAGIHPHPTREGVFLLAANAHPAYPAGQAPRLPEQYRGKLLTFDSRSGAIVGATALTGGDYGGIAAGGGSLFVSSLDPPEVLQLDANRGTIQRRVALAGPAGGLAYDESRGALLAQLYTGVPHLAVVDVRTGRTVEMLWSDENAMDLASVGGDLLCTWASGFDGHAFGDLRLIDRATGRVRGRMRLDAVHTSMAPLTGSSRFVAMVRTGADGGVALRTYLYDRAAARW